MEDEGGSSVHLVRRQVRLLRAFQDSIAYKGSKTSRENGCGSYFSGVTGGGGETHD